VAPTKTQIQPQSPVPTSGKLEEQVVIDRVGDAIAGAAAEQRRALLAEDARRAARRAAVEIASAALSANSADTAAHSDDVDVISEAIGRQLGLSEQGVDDVVVAARLHDIGKLGIPQRIIEKPAALDDDEWAVIRRHTIIGEQILVAVPELRGAAHLVRHSHERWDGAGYPDGLAGKEIPLGSRIVFCADAYHAIRSDRPYRQGRSAAEALAEIRSCAGTQFDPYVVEALEELAGDLCKERNGSRPRSIRYRRLTALMLIVSVGACSSALARSGLMPEAKAFPASPGQAATVT
jgi:HD-GYP domain-containing protein (c-di-GMP phosphodiesterase class II)